MTETGADWRLLAGITTAWFDTSSLTEGAALAERVLSEAPGAAVDLRSTGARVRLCDDEHSRAEAVSAAARETACLANSDVLQQLSVVFESPNPAEVGQFWRRVLRYQPSEAGTLEDPLRRDPAIQLQQSDGLRPLRSRVHLDVGRPGAVIEEIGLGEASGPYGVRHIDPDGNEVDLIPSGPLADGSDTSDWYADFSAMACYRTTSLLQQRDLAAAAAAIADDAGFGLVIDLRPGLVIIDSGKDQWMDDVHGLAIAFTELAEKIQSAARALEAIADPGLARFTQIFFDAADIPAVRAFWEAALGYEKDQREGVNDLYDPQRLNPVLGFQDIDGAETDRRQQRNRIHVELAVPQAAVQSRLDAALASGGQLLDQGPDRWRIADPEDNELVIVCGD